MPSLGGWEWVILALIALLLFGGSRLAGIGKNAGKAIREFKEETTALRSGSSPSEPPPAQPGPPAQQPGPSVQPSPSAPPADPDADSDKS